MLFCQQTVPGTRPRPSSAPAELYDTHRPRLRQWAWRSWIAAEIQREPTGILVHACEDYIQHCQRIAGAKAAAAPNGFPAPAAESRASLLSVDSMPALHY